eukprot:4157173-Alexandrium_andersonii.AAC.1
MSASLVGSEMCIRDSCSAKRTPTSAHAAKCPQKRAPSRNTWARNRPKPVSYTHLTLPTICSV